MSEATPNIGYSNVENEIVDNNSTEEKEFVDKINKSIDSAKELFGLECDHLAENSLENLNKKQLSAFLTKNYFEGGVKTYSQCLSTGKFLNFSMKAALQLLSKGDNSKYDINGKPSDSGMTIDEIIGSRGGIDLDTDAVLVKILQRKVGAHPDGKPGPQTIASVICALGGDISNIYEGVNKLYSNNEKFKIQNISEFTIGGINYKYDKNQFSIGLENGKVKITYNGEINEIDVSKKPPVCKGFTFENGWIKRSGAVSSSIEVDSNDVFEVISGDVSIDKNGNLVDGGGEKLNSKKTDFVSGLIDSECRRKHGKEGKRSGYNISHSDCVLSMNNGKLTYSKDSKKINYENGKIKFNITMSSDNGQNIFTISDDSYKYKGDLSDLRFTDLSEAINTLKLIEYIKIRFDGVETGANTGNRDYDGGTDNDSPFFAADRALYFSSDHGGFGGAFGGHDDENIISIDNLKKISATFRKNDDRVKFAKYLIKAVGYEEEH